MLRYLATQPEPVPLESLARALRIPRSSAYHLVNAMIEEGFVTHVEDEHRYGLGMTAFEVGTGYLRHEPLQRVARRPLAELVDALGESCHLAVLHGREVVYVIEERAKRRPPLVTDVGVRLPAQLTASGRAILAALPAAQVRALFPGRDSFFSRTGSGPASLSALNALLARARQHGHATESGEVTAGLSSVAVAVRDHVGFPVAAVAVTYETRRDATAQQFVRAVAATAGRISQRVGGHRG
jgi:DNA-binding IclR family transcriptional regulator